MKVRKLLISTLLGLLSTTSIAQSNIWVKSENIQQVVKSTEFQSIMKGLQIDVTITNPLSNSRNPELKKVYQIECECDVVDLYSAMHKVPGVSGIEYGPVYETLSEPNDYSTTFNGNWALDLINANGAWSVTTGNSNINIAISDQNFYVNHEELTGKINHYDTTNTATKTHGTAVAIIAAGNTNNGVGLASIGYNSTLSLYRMNYNEVLAASYAGAKVINMSWASGCSFNTYAQQALTEVYNNGTFLIASAGNGSTCGGANNLVYPAAYANVFAVTSVGSQDNIEKTIGNPSTRHQTNSSVDICAPGHDVPLTSAPGFYVTGNGTSFAAPYVTGTVGLMLAANPNLTTNEIDSILRITATNIDSLNTNYIGNIGVGRLNAEVAVKTAYLMTITVNEDDGNNGHGNDEDGVDNSNPGQGGDHGNGNGKPNKNNVKSAFAGELAAYDMNGKQVNLEYAPAGMYLIVDNGTITKIIK